MLIIFSLGFRPTSSFSFEFEPCKIAEAIAAESNENFRKLVFMQHIIIVILIAT